MRSANSATPQDQTGLPNSDGPIADLTYRNYDGPLHSRAVRWSTIALAMFRLNLKSTAFKVVAILAVLPYIFMIVLLYMQGQINQTTGSQITGVMSSLIDNTVGQKYAIVFYNALGFQLIYLVILTLISGAGSIASDNRNNALLIYLSKPITKNDYLIGKWVGLFLTLFMVAFGPALLLYLYCLTSYLGDGFLRDESMLFLHVVESTAITSALFTSLMIGLSAWSKSPRITGAILAAIYFASQIVAFALWIQLSGGKPNKAVLVLHGSIGGIVSGLTQGIYKVTIHSVLISRRTHIIRQTIIPPPPGVIMWSVAIGLIVAGIIAARAKIRAVEVIA